MSLDEKCINYGKKPECNYCNMYGENCNYDVSDCYVPKVNIKKIENDSNRERR